MFRVIEGKEFIEIQSYLPAGRRVLLFLLALFPLLAPYELIIRTNWHSYLNVFFLFAAAISAGTVAVSVFLMWAAIAGLNSKLRFDKGDANLTYSAGAPIVRWRTHQCPIERIAHLRVQKHDWSDGVPSYSFMAQMVDGSKFQSGSSWSRKEIDDIVQRVQAFLGMSTRV